MIHAKRVLFELNIVSKGRAVCGCGGNQGRNGKVLAFELDV